MISLVLIAFGCNQNLPAPQPRGPFISGEGRGKFVFAEPPLPIDGYNRAYINYGSWSDDDLAYVMWSNLNGSTDGTQRGHFRTHHPSGEIDKRINYSIKVADAKEDTVATIDGRDFKFRNGTLFLVSASGDDIRIEQVDADLSHLSSIPTDAQFKRLRDTTPAIPRFFNSTGQRP